MSILVGLTALDIEDPTLVEKTIRAYKQEGADIAIAYDEYSNMPFNSILAKYGGGSVLKVNGFGLGKARNALAMYAWQRKYDCLILSDSHVDIVKGKASDLCNGFAEAPIQTDQLHIAKDVGIILSYYTFQWIHVLDADYIPMTANPVTAFSYRALDALISAQGCFTPVYYWGTELFDPTVSLARLGYWIRVNHNVVLEHHYRQKEELGKYYDIRNNVPPNKEPFYYIARDTLPYYAGIQFAYAVYAYKHYRPFFAFVFDGGIPRRLPIDIRMWFVFPEDVRNAIVMFNNNAKYSLYDVYKELERRIASGMVKLYGGVNIWS